MVNGTLMRVSELTGHGPHKMVEALAGKEDVLVAVGEPVRALHAGKVLEHSLLHRELHK